MSLVILEYLINGESLVNGVDLADEKNIIWDGKPMNALWEHSVDVRVLSSLLYH